MRWATYFAVLASVLSVGLALGVSMPLVSLRLEGWGYGSFAIGVMAAMPAIGVLLGAKISSHLAARLGTANLMRLCLWAGALSIGLLALLPSYPVWLVLRLMIGVILTAGLHPRRKLDQPAGGRAMARAPGGAVWQQLCIEPAGRAVVAGRSGHRTRLWFLGRRRSC